MVRLILAAFVTCFPVLVAAEYSDDCSRRARALRDAADSFDSQLSSYKSACDQYYGYSKNDENACGPYGYLTSSLKSAASELDDANDRVRRDCGTCDGIASAAFRGSAQVVSELKKENADLKKRIAQLELENADLKKAKP